MKQGYLNYLQELGAEARAKGSSFLENPFLKNEHQPAASGESIDTWQRKHDAWHLGWTAEDIERRR